MESSNTTSGSVFSLSAAELIERCYISVYPETVENSAAPNEETEAITIATPSIREAWLPSFVIEGAINPMIIKGTQKLINCPKIYFAVTTTFKMALVAALPSA